MGKNEFQKKTVRDISLKGKRVLLRADYNVPISDGKIRDTYRIAQSLPTISYILEQGASGLVIISHLGRPLSSNDQQFSLRPVAAKLAELLDKKISFAHDCVGDDVKRVAEKLMPGEVLMLENLRFHQEEEKNDPGFAKAIKEAAGADIFVQDGFGVVHRAHASTDAITKLMPSVAGLLLEKEVTTIEQVMSAPARPLTAVIGGAKISDKIGVLDKFIDIADCVAVGGALADNFLHVERINVGSSLVELEAYSKAEEVLEKARRAERTRGFVFLVPTDGVVSTSADGKAATRVVEFGEHFLTDVEAYPHRPKEEAHRVGGHEKILDIGPASAARIAGAINVSKTVVWAGTLGVTETPGLAGTDAPFSHGTRVVTEAMIGTSNQHKNKPFSLVGGGDTVSYIESQKMTEDFNHVSTGGGASLELMAGNKLPGIEALEAK